MFVPTQFSVPAQAIAPHCTLKQSSSCVTLHSYTVLDEESRQESNESPVFPRATDLLRQGLKSYNTDANRFSVCSNARTRNQFKPQRANKGTTSYQLRQFAEATLGSGSLRKAVKLPEGEDLNEWLAVNGMFDPRTMRWHISDRKFSQWSTFTIKSI